MPWRLVISGEIVEQAEEAIQMSLTLDPDDADAFSVLARTLLGRQRYEDALAVIDQGLAIDPEHGDCGSCAYHFGETWA